MSMYSNVDAISADGNCKSDYGNRRTPDGNTGSPSIASLVTETRCGDVDYEFDNVKSDDSFLESGDKSTLKTNWIDAYAGGLPMDRRRFISHRQRILLERRRKAQKRRQLALERRGIVSEKVPFGSERLALLSEGNRFLCNTGQFLSANGQSRPERRQFLPHTSGAYPNCSSNLTSSHSLNQLLAQPCSFYQPRTESVVVATDKRRLPGSFPIDLEPQVVLPNPQKDTNSSTACEIPVGSTVGPNNNGVISASSDFDRDVLSSFSDKSEVIEEKSGDVVRINDTHNGNSDNSGHTVWHNYDFTLKKDESNFQGETLDEAGDKGRPISEKFRLGPERCCLKPENNDNGSYKYFGVPLDRETLIPEGVHFASDRNELAERRAFTAEKQRANVERRRIISGLYKNSSDRRAITSDRPETLSDIERQVTVFVVQTDKTNDCCTCYCFRKVMSACLPTTSYKTHHENIDHYSLPKSRDLPLGQRTKMSYTDHTIRYSDDGTEGLSVTYITERIIAMLFPSGGMETTYKYHLDQVATMLQTKHANNVLVVNLSQPKSEVSKLNTQVVEFGWPEHLAPPLERVCSLCKVLDNWLMSNPQHVVVIHCRGEQGRMGVIVASYMHYTNICASADQALDRFAMKRFYDDKLSVLTQPSQRRYVNYFAGLLSGSIKINSDPLYLHHILIHGVPNFDTKGGCRPFIKIYESMQPVFNSGVYNVTDNMQKVCISIQPGIALRGDILIKCYHKKFRSGGRDIIWRCQFHTCAISSHNVMLAKRELDDACYDPRFPDSGKVELVFSTSDKSPSHVSGFKSDITVPIDEVGDILQRRDSYENFSDLNTAINGYVDNISSSSGFHVNELSGNFRTKKFNDSPQKSPQVTSREQSQLDEILRDLLGEVNLGSETKTTTTTKTTYNYSSETDGTLKKDVQQVNYTSPGWTDHKVTTTRTTYGDEVKSPEIRSPPERKPFIPRNAFTYTPGGTEKTVERTAITTSPKQPAYETRIEERYTYSTAAEKPQSSPNTELSWLEIQQQKLKAKQEGRTDSRIRQEKQLVQELKNAQSQYTTKRHQSDSDNAGTLLTSYSQSQPVVVNGNVTPTRNFSTYHYATTSRDGAVTPTYSTTSTLRQNDHDFNQELFNSQWSETYSTTLSSGKPKQKPPSVPAKSPAAPVTPQRSSSRDYMQQRSATSSEWQSHGRPLGRQQSDTSYNRQFSQPKSSTPPLGTPHTFSPPYQVEHSYSSATYDTRPEVKAFSPPVATDTQKYRTEVYIHRNAPQPDAKTTDVTRDHSDTTHTLDELEKLLQSTTTEVNARQQVQPGQIATKSTFSDTPLQQHQQQQQQQRMETRYETWQTTQVQKFETQQGDAPPVVPVPAPVQAPPPPKKSTIVEEENIMLRPIGVQTLEPDDAGTGSTLVVARGRTPTFAPPETPPFPVSPVSHYTNQASVSDVTSYQYSQRSNVHGTDGTLGRSPQQMVTQNNPPIIIEQPYFNHVEPSQQQFHTTQTTHTSQEIHQQQQQQPQSPGSLLIQQQQNLAEQQRLQHNLLVQQQQQLQQQQLQLKEQQIKEQQLKQQQIQQQQIQEQQELVEKQRLEQQNLQLQQQQLADQQRKLQQHQQIQQQQLIQQQNQQQQKMQEQFQTEQQQFITTSETRQFTTEQHQFNTQDVQQRSGTLPRALHVDTSRNYHQQSGGTLTRSPHSVSSPPSPGTVDRFRTHYQSASGHHTGSMTLSPGAHSLTGQSSPSVYYGLSRRGSMTSLADFDVVNTMPKFVKDTSKLWYKPHISREEAIAMLKDKAPGTFVVRDSNSFPGAFGLAVKVAQVPANVHTKPSGDPLADLVRHFLIEPTPKGVRLKGCANEPVFGSLAALVYQHSMTPLALPCKLTLPEPEHSMVDGLLESPTSPDTPGTASSLLEQGAACNVLYLNSVDTESLTGPVAIAKALNVTVEMDPPVKTTVVHFKVSSQGITLTDNKRKLFFRRHYPVAAVTYCGLDKEDRRWKSSDDGHGLINSKIFGFIARKQGGVSDNACHLFAELDADQPASAIVNFVTKVMMSHGKK